MSRKRKNGNGDTNNKPYNVEFKPKTKGQTEYVRAIAESEITFCTGPAGSGKTACATGLACEYLLHNKVKNIIISRPIVETGFHGLGTLPGELYNKIHPYLVPMLEELYIYLGRYNTDNLIQNGTIRIIPLEVMRGYNMHNSFIILDEAQNAMLSQLKMFLTRIGWGSKMVITGDIAQSDLDDNHIGLKTCVTKLTNIRGVSIIELTHQDIIRNGIISKILEKL